MKPSTHERTVMEVFLVTLRRNESPYKLISAFNDPNLHSTCKASGCFESVKWPIGATRCL